MRPSLSKAKELFLFATKHTNILNVKMGLPKGISSKHYQNVAYVASKIAEQAGMDVEKAYVLGLLHDYGEYIEDTISGAFHGTAGYDEMLKLGFDEVANVCLSHSFFNSSFSPEDFPAYETKETERAAVILNEKSFDDYDKLIHLADLMSPGSEINTIENRVQKLSEKYNIPFEKTQKMLRQGLELKRIFDNKCNKDIYSLFELS